MSRRRTLVCLAGAWTTLPGLFAAAWNGWTLAGVLMLPVAAGIGALCTHLDTIRGEPR